MALTLGDAFNRRKKIGADLQAWIARLSQSGSERREYRTKEIEGKSAFEPEPGSERTIHRHYEVEECRQKISELLVEDQGLAMCISLTNQKAMASIVDLDGNSLELSVPELLVLKGDIIPKLEEFARSVPARANGVSIYEEGEGFFKHRSVKKVMEKKQTMSDKGMKIEETKTIGYDIVETKDFGIPVRDAYNEIDRIQDFAQRVKQAINRANKTELVELPRSS